MSRFEKNTPKVSAGVIGKMKKLLNDRGYALLIVLFTIIIFLSMSAVFMSASLNHVKQEQTVDQKNQAVVAAELGVKYVESHMQNQISLLYRKHVTELEAAVNNLAICNGNIEHSNCKSQTKINSLTTEQIEKFFIELKTSYQSIKIIDNKIIDNEVTYSVLDQSVVQVNTTLFNGVNYYKLPFSVEGNSDDKPAVLKNELLVPIPTFVSSITSKNKPAPEPNPNDSTAMNRYLFTPPVTNKNCKDIKPLTEGVICKLSKTENIASVFENSQNGIDFSKITILAEDIESSFCPNGSCAAGYNNLKVYSNKDISIDQIKALNQLTLFLDGIINIDTNGNNYAGTAIVKGVNSDSHFKNIRGNVFITGDNNNPIRLKIDNHTDAKFGKLCINLDGIDVPNSFFEVKGGNSKHENVYYFTSNSTKQIPDAERFRGTYKDFVGFCINSVNVPIPPPVTEVTASYIDKQQNAKVIVNYNP